LLLDHSAADQLVHGRFCKRGADSFAITMTIAVVRDEGLIGGDVVAELADRPQQLLPLGADPIAPKHRLQSVH